MGREDWKKFKSRFVVCNNRLPFIRCSLSLSFSMLLQHIISASDIICCPCEQNGGEEEDPGGGEGEVEIGDLIVGDGEEGGEGAMVAVGVVTWIFTIQKKHLNITNWK